MKQYKKIENLRNSKPTTHKSNSENLNLNVRKYKINYNALKNEIRYNLNTKEFLILIKNRNKLRDVIRNVEKIRIEF